jgi:hypothetical protein
MRVVTGRHAEHGRGVLPVTPVALWCFAPPVISLALGAITRAGYCRFEHADQIRFSLCRPSGSANRPVYAAIGVTLKGRKDVLGLWAGTGGEGCGTATGSAGRAAAAA